MWELDHKESWAPKSLYFWTVVLEKTLDSPLDFEEIQPVNPKGNQSWIFIGRTDAKAESSNTLADWCKELTHLKRPWCWKRLKAGGEGDDRGSGGWMASPTQWTWVCVTLEVGDGRGGLVCSSPWGHKESDTTELNYEEILTLLPLVGSDLLPPPAHTLKSFLDHLREILTSKGFFI